METSEAAEQPSSYVLDFLRQSNVPGYIAEPLKPVGRALDRVTRPFGLAEYPAAHVPEHRRRAGDVVFAGRRAGACSGGGCGGASSYFDHTGGFGQFTHCLQSRLPHLCCASSWSWWSSTR